VKKAISTPRAPSAIGPYSQAVEAGSMVFVSGQIPLDATGKLADGGLAAQAEQCLMNLEAILEAAGLSTADVVKTTVFLTDLSQFAAFNDVYARHFKSPYPARSTIQVSALPKGAGVEIEAVAVRGK
jgi:2-iminobutanoate/2-iminopropanoate deaminase